MPTCRAPLSPPEAPPAPGGEPTPLSANALQLSPREWLAALGLLAGILLVFFALRPKIASPQLAADYRIPYPLTDHYDLYERYSVLAASRYDVLLVGDSVVWGQCCDRDQTLAHHLNSLSGSERFANLGLDGMHPVALSLLLQYHAPGISGKQVVLQANPLWYISTGPQRGREELLLNRPHLGPRIGPTLASYHEKIAQVLGSALGKLPVARTLGLAAGQLASQRLEVLSWSLEHPYENPLKTLTYLLPEPEKRAPRPPPVPFARLLAQENALWEELETSVQWAEFKHAVEILEERGNRVFIVLGPLNEAILTPASRSAYAGIKRQMEQWCQRTGHRYAVAEPPPSEAFEDICHPTGAGYLELAKRLRQAHPSPFAPPAASP
jgi:hypothetical protein